jgi:transcriptional regulator, lysR family
LVYNAALLAEQNIGYILNPNKLVNAKDRTVCFRPFTPALKAGLGIVWEKYRFFSPVANF